jgi:hypothetical protein
MNPDILESLEKRLKQAILCKEQERVTIYIEALDLLKSQPKTSEQATLLKVQCYIGLGNAHQGKQQGLEYFEKALELLDTLKNYAPLLYFHSLMGAGNALLAAKDSKSIYYYRRALEYVKEHRLNRRYKSLVEFRLNAAIHATSSTS